MGEITLTPLKIIPTNKGDILRGLKKSEESFTEFGEAYFSFVHKNLIKGWKKHTKMVLNLIVPIGEIEFIIFNEKNCEFKSIVLSKNNYQRLTIEPGLWVAFRGLSEENLLLNIASIEHNPKESITCELEEIYYEW